MRFSPVIQLQHDSALGHKVQKATMTHEPSGNWVLFSEYVDMERYYERKIEQLNCMVDKLKHYEKLSEKHEADAEKYRKIVDLLNDKAGKDDGFDESIPQPRGKRGKRAAPQD